MTTQPVDPWAMCDGWAEWSVWLHTPDWGAEGGMTRVLCNKDALDLLTDHAYAACRETMRTRLRQNAASSEAHDA